MPNRFLEIENQMKKSCVFFMQWIPAGTEMSEIFEKWTPIFWNFLSKLLTDLSRSKTQAQTICLRCIRLLFRFFFNPRNLDAPRMPEGAFSLAFWTFILLFLELNLLHFSSTCQLIDFTQTPVIFEFLPFILVLNITIWSLNGQKG